MNEKAEAIERLAGGETDKYSATVDIRVTPEGMGAVIVDGFHLKTAAKVELTMEEGKESELVVTFRRVAAELKGQVGDGRQVRLEFAEAPADA